MRDQFKIGAQAGIAVATLGSGVEGAVNSGGAGHRGVEFVQWRLCGVALNGSVLRPQLEDDRAYYGRPLTTRDIVFGHLGVAPRATVLRHELATVG